MFLKEFEVSYCKALKIWQLKAVFKKRNIEILAFSQKEAASGTVVFSPQKAYWWLHQGDSEYPTYLAL